MKTDDVRGADPHETALVSGYRNPRLLGVNEIMPIVEVGKERGSYTEYGPDAAVIREGLEQPLGAGRKSIDMTVYKGDFACVKVGVNVPLYDDEIDEAADKETLSEKKALLGESVIQIGMEKTVADYIQTGSNYASGFTEALTGTARWDDYVNSDPIKDIIRFIDKLETVVEAETHELAVGVGPAVWSILRLHPKCKVFSAGGSTEQPASLQDMAVKIGCKKFSVLRGKVIETFDRKDPRNSVYARLWGKVCVVYQPIEKPSIDKELWGAIVREKSFPRTKTYRDEGRDADIKATTDKWGLHVRSNNRGFLGETVIN